MALLTLVLSLLDDVLALVSVEPRLHAEVRLSAPLVELVPRFVSREAVAEDSLKTHTENGSGIRTDEATHSFSFL